jgi:hypothetical protein
VKPPRITGSTSAAPPFAGDLPETLGVLTPYTDGADASPGLPAVMPASSLPRLRQRPEVGPVITVAVLVASVVTLALALAVGIRQGNRRGVVRAAPDLPAIVTASGRDGADRLHCMADVVSIMVTRPGVSGDNVLAAWVDAMNGTMELVLRPAAGGFRGYLYVNEGVLRTEPRTGGLPIWPGERIVLRVQGLIDARELHVTGRQLRLGSQGEGPCP